MRRKGLEVSRTDAMTMVSFFCWKLGLKQVPVQWTNRRTERAHYEPPKRYTLPVGKISFSYPLAEWVVLHEVAHYVVQMRAPKYTAREMRRYSGLRRGYQRAAGWGQSSRRNQKVQHGPTFVRTVKELATIWYGDEKLYPWELEYRSLRGEGGPA